MHSRAFDGFDHGGITHSNSFRGHSSVGGGYDAIPFNGYYFRILTGQGTNAPDGTKSYIVDDKTISGFDFVAYPAEYRSSGVMTFILNENGTVYEKDLGPNTPHLANGMAEYDSTWHRAD